LTCLSPVDIPAALLAAGFFIQGRSALSVHSDNERLADRLAGALYGRINKFELQRLLIKLGEA
jgi:hypothetical protein